LKHARAGLFITHHPVFPAFAGTSFAGMAIEEPRNKLTGLFIDISEPRPGFPSDVTVEAWVLLHIDWGVS
jgi:hypothetical protein